LSNTLAEVDACELIEKLMAHALRVFAEYGLSGKNAVVPGVGWSAEDFVFGLLKEYLVGKIKTKDLSYLYTALRNDIIDKLKSASHKTTDHMPLIPQGDLATEKPECLDEYPSKGVRPDDYLCEESYKLRVRRSVADKPDLREVVEAVFDLDLEKPAEIADALKTTAKDVYARNRKLRLRLLSQGIAEVPHEK
jgi:DNA-directed RNA polymerase specialized sigma24 family protein